MARTNRRRIWAVPRPALCPAQPLAALGAPWGMSARHFRNAFLTLPVALLSDCSAPGPPVSVTPCCFMQLLKAVNADKPPAPGRSRPNPGGRVLPAGLECFGPGATPEAAGELPTPRGKLTPGEGIPLKEGLPDGKLTLYCLRHCWNALVPAACAPPCPVDPVLLPHAVTSRPAIC